MFQTAEAGLLSLLSYVINLVNNHEPSQQFRLKQMHRVKFVLKFYKCRNGSAGIYHPVLGSSVVVRNRDCDAWDPAYYVNKKTWYEAQFRRLWVA